MKAKEIITEGSDIVYHRTELDIALKILQSRKFKPTNTDFEMTKKHSHSYSLSTSRNKFNSFEDGGNTVFNLNGRWLNQRYKSEPFDYDYHTMEWDFYNEPDEYGDYTDEQILNSKRKVDSEQEERFLTNNPTIQLPAKLNQVIHSIHVLHTDDYKLPPYKKIHIRAWAEEISRKHNISVDDAMAKILKLAGGVISDNDYDKNIKILVRIAKKNLIPVYEYKDEKFFRIQRNPTKVYK